MTATRHPGTAGRILAVAGLLAVLVAVAVLLLGLTGWATVTVALGSVLALALWSLVEVRRERARFEGELRRSEVAQVLLAERIRMAQEVHDLISHGLGMITVRASSAVYLLGHGEDPSATEQELLGALTDIERTSRDATAELRRTVAALRDPGEAGPLRPASGLDVIPGLIDRAREAGLTVSYRPDAAPGALPARVQQTVVAVVREGLANAARHAGPTEVTIDIRQTGTRLIVSIENAAPAPSWQARPGSGHGLIGLRERVTALGGTLDAGPHETGYRLRATITEPSS